MAAAGVVTDPTDGKLVHLDGLNLSRAWMLEGIAQGLPAEGCARAVAARRSGACIATRAWMQSRASITKAATGWAHSRSTW